MSTRRRLSFVSFTVLFLAALFIYINTASAVSPLSMTRAAHAAHTQQGDNSVLAPLFTEEQKLTASDGAAFDGFGGSVAFGGSTVVVGARNDDIGGHFDQGSAYVFNREGGSWVEVQKLTASDGAEGDEFGMSVAFNGSTIIVGAWLKNIGGNPAQGAAYVFNRQGGSWVETQKLTASDGAAESAFGFSVAFSGSTVVVGAPADNHRGAAYVFNREGGSWVEEQKLTASDRPLGGSFGSSVAISGSTVVVGAGGDNGAAYVFNREGGSWVEEQKLTPTDRQLFGFFGFSVAITGPTIVVSSPADDIGGNIDQGAVYVFNREGGSWIEEQKLILSDGKPNDFFGNSVAISGSTLVVGAAFETIGVGNLTRGAVYVFNRQGRSWIEEQKLTASDGGLRDFFGRSVAISGSTVVVGADNSGNINQGAAYIFER